MAYTFNEKPDATIKAKITGTENTISVQGTNPTAEPNDAKAQINKVLALVGNKTVTVEGMTRTRTSEVVEND